MTRLVGSGAKLRGLAGRIPSAGWICALVAALSAMVWSLIVPTFQVVDEPAHVAYVQYLAEAGRPPSGERGPQARSDEQNALMRALRYKQVEFRPDNRPLITPRAEDRLERTLDEDASRRGEGGYTRAAGNPPLYYVLGAAAYRASPSTDLVDRIQVMRLVSALLAALTVLFIFCFLRELLPATPWAWTVGALVVALQPVFGNLSGAVNSDNLLYTASAGMFFAFALCFRRGLTPGRGAAIGALLAIGVLAKLNTLGFLPGVGLGLILLVVRADRETRRTAIAGAAAAAIVAAIPVIAYVALNSDVWDRGAYFSGTGGERSKPDPTTPTSTGLLSYIWQFYLPRLPFMGPQFDSYQLIHVWFDGFVGRFGVLEYGFGTAVDAAAALVYTAVAGLVGRELFRRREHVKARSLELLTYAALAIGLLVAIHKAGYDGRSLFYEGFEQARYLFPLLPLYGAIVAIAVRGAGRFAPAAGVVLVSLAVSHGLLAYLLTLTRYYG